MTLVLRVYKGGESLYILPRVPCSIRVGLAEDSRNPPTARLFIDTNEHTTKIMRDSVIERNYIKLYEKLRNGENLTDEEFLSLKNTGELSR